jgi:curved DNA-binding protein CbpA
VVSAEEGRRRLRRLARELHPDRHAGADPAVRAAKAARLAEATAAYHGLR